MLRANALLVSLVGFLAAAPVLADPADKPPVKPAAESFDEFDAPTPAPVNPTAPSVPVGQLPQAPADQAAAPVPPPLNPSAAPQTPVAVSAGSLPAAPPTSPPPNAEPSKISAVAIAPAPPPAQTPPSDPAVAAEVSERKQAAMQKLSAGDVVGARAEIQTALEADPQDERLKQVAGLLTEHVKSPVDEKELGDKARSLLSAPEAGASPSAVLASPIAWSGTTADPAAMARAAAQAAHPSEEFLKRDPEQVGLAKLGLGDYPAAEKALSLKIERDPGDWLAYRLRALARRKLQKPEAAYSDASRALALNPKDGYSRDIRALSLIDLGRYPEAVTDANEALALNARDAGALVARAQAEQKLKQDERSIADLKAAAELDPQFEALYRQALGLGEAPARPSSPLLPYAAAGSAIAILLFAADVLRKRGRSGATATRTPMRQADRFAGADRGEDTQPKGFQILRRLGQGGMGIVYEAMDQALQRKVAVKKMREEVSADSRARRRFLKEARTVAALHHPNIVEIYSVFAQGHELFLVFEYVAGDALNTFLGPDKRMSPAAALGLIRQVTMALDYAHSQGVIHQDLKPANIMLSGETAKVMDFGIARRVQETLSTLSQAEVMGTPGYMAPEQAHGQFLKESDIYSLGVCFYEMLSGINPFQGGDSYLLKMQCEYRNLTELVPSLPAGINPLIAKALNPDPSRRFPSGRAFLAEAERVLGA